MFPRALLLLLLPLLGCEPADPVEPVDGPGGPADAGVEEPPPDPVPAEVAQAEAAVHAGIDAERATAGLPPLRRTPALDAVARRHSRDMQARDFFSHVNPDGSDPFDRMRAAGIPFRAAAENIHWSSGYREPAQRAVDDWMGSPGHRANILDESGYGFTHTGVGLATDGNGRWWSTQVFHRP